MAKVSAPESKPAEKAAKPEKAAPKAGAPAPAAKSAERPKATSWVHPRPSSEERAEGAPEVREPPPENPAEAPKSSSWVQTKASARAGTPKTLDFQAVKRDARPKAPAAPPAPVTGLGKLLQDAQEPGKYFRRRNKRGGGAKPGEAPDDGDLSAAVDEARRLLAGVKGIEQIGPGENEAGEPVVLIAAARGFTEASMRAVPWHVGRFATLVAVPFELLPLHPG